MFRFLSGRKGRSGDVQNSHHKNVPHKNIIQCKVILLDGTDLSVELSVSEIELQCITQFLVVWWFIVGVSRCTCT